jgi:hypothetical protein
MPRPANRGPGRRRSGPLRDGDRPGREGDRVCGSCGQPAAQTVLIAVFGVMLVKDLCGQHLILLLDGARETLRPPAGVEPPRTAGPGSPF